MAKSAKHKALTVKRIERLKTQPGRYRDGSGEVKGLYLQVESKTNISWLLRYQRDGREHWMGLGPLETVSLKQAREKAVAARQQLTNKVDPIAARKAAEVARVLAEAKNKTFRECAEDYIAANRSGWKNVKHSLQWSATLKTYVYPKIGNLPVAEIDTELVRQILQPIWESKTETASRLRARIETILDYATVCKLRSGDNPAAWAGKFEHLLPAKAKTTKIEHHPALDYQDIPRFMTALRQREGVAAKALEFLALTAARTGAVIGATRDEIDFKTKIWTVPPARVGTKITGDKPRRIPLSDRAIEILESLPVEDGNPFLFIGGKTGSGLSNMAMNELLKAMAWPSTTPGRLATAHGMRSSFKDWVSESTSYPNHVSEAALWHAVADKVEAAYRRGDLFDKRRKLMNEWAGYCTSPPARVSADVVAIRGIAP